jgi:hypothetical protein
MEILIEEEIKKIKDLINKKAITEAREKLNAVLAADKKNADAYYLYGYIEVLSNNYPLAESLFKLALENNPLNANAAYYIGVCEEKLGLQASAMVYYKKALELNPNHAMAREKVPATLHHDPAPPPPPPPNNNNQTNTQQAPKVVTPHKFKSKSYRPFTGPTSEFYERLTLDKSFEAQSAAQIIKEIEVKIVPRSIDYWRSFLPLIFVPFLPFLIVAIWEEATHSVVNLNPDEGDTLVYFSFAFGLACILYRRLVIKQRHYYFSNGNLTVRKGLFSVKNTKWELYRVENIEWNSDILGRSSLVLRMMHNKSAIKLHGMGTREDAEFMCNRLNELVRILRMYSSLKGVIN